MPQWDAHVGGGGCLLGAGLAAQGFGCVAKGNAQGLPSAGLLVASYPAALAFTHTVASLLLGDCPLQSHHTRDVPQASRLIRERTWGEGGCLLVQGWQPGGMQLQWYFNLFDHRTSHKGGSSDSADCCLGAAPPTLTQVITSDAGWWAKSK